MTDSILLTPINNNEFHDYIFEIWQLGIKTDTYRCDNLFSARKFYAANGASSSFAIKLYIDGKLINFLNMSNVLQINKMDKYKLDLNF